MKKPEHSDLNNFISDLIKSIDHSIARVEAAKRTVETEKMLTLLYYIKAETSKDKVGVLSDMNERNRLMTELATIGSIVDEQIASGKKDEIRNNYNKMTKAIEDYKNEIKSGNLEHYDELKVLLKRKENIDAIRKG